MMLNVALALVLAAPPLSLEHLELAPEATPALTAQRLVAQHPAALGLGAADTLRDLLVVPLARGTLVKARRSHQGLPVIGQSVAIRFDASGRPISVRSDFAPLPDLGEATITGAEAAAVVAQALFGASINPASIDTTEIPMRLAVDPKRAALVWVVHVPHVLPQWRRTALVHAQTGDLLEIKNPVKRAADDADVYLPRPDPDAVLGAPTTVTLERLTPATPQYLEGEYVTAYSCLINVDDVRVRTCFDVYGGLACMAPEFANLILSFCGEGHIAEGQGDTDGFMFPPEDDLTDYGVGSWPFTDPFAEVHVYYHLDQVTHWLRALGHPVAMHTPFQIMSNVNMPSPELIDCETVAWTAEPSGSRSAARAREIVGECMIAGHDYVAFDNAFYLGDELEALVGVGEGIYMGQGSVADFGYDGGIIYHEYGHAVAAQVQSLGGGQLLDEWGIDDAPGALGEAYGDYFAGAFTGDPVLAGYVSGRYGDPSGFRNLSNTKTCPNHLTGEVHDDSEVWSAALWDARALFPQTETDSDTGMEVRVFDRVVYEALASLTDLSNQDDAAAATIDAVKNEPALGDTTGATVTGALEARNVVACERARLVNDTPIPRMHFASATAGMFGGASFSPYVPGPYQLVLETNNATDATITMELGAGLVSFENPPDWLGGDPGDPIWELQLLYRSEQPIVFSYSGTSDVTVTAESEGSVPLTVTGANPPSVTASLPLPANTERVYFALVNSTDSGGSFENITATVSGQHVIPPPPGGGDPDEGCDCAGASSGLAGLAVLLLALRRRRR